MGRRVSGWRAWLFETYSSLLPDYSFFQTPNTKPSSFRKIRSSSKVFSARSPNYPRPRLVSDTHQDARGSSRMRESQKLSQTRLREGPQLLQVTLIPGSTSHRTSLRGRKAPASHTCPGPSKALTLPWLPSQQPKAPSREFIVTATGNRRSGPEKRPWAPHPPLATSKAGVLAVSLSQGRICRTPGGGERTLHPHLYPHCLSQKGHVLFQPWPSDLPWHLQSQSQAFCKAMSVDNHSSPTAPSWKRVERSQIFLIRWSWRSNWGSAMN